MQPQAPASIWTYKPWWCQPWSILLTGITLITASWLLFHLRWLTALVAIPIGAWMGFFLLVYPKAMLQAMQAEAETGGD
jgi:hypothetical protein